MSTIEANQPELPAGGKPRMRWESYVPGHHWRNADDEFDSAKFGMWLFLSTEILLFAGLFVAQTVHVREIGAGTGRAAEAGIVLYGAVLLAAVLLCHGVSFRWGRGDRRVGFSGPRAGGWCGR